MIISAYMVGFNVAQLFIFFCFDFRFVTEPPSLLHRSDEKVIYYCFSALASDERTAVCDLSCTRIRARLSVCLVIFLFLCDESDVNIRCRSGASKRIIENFQEMP